jgi:hypothetical protein
MAETLLLEGKVLPFAGARTEGDALWVPEGELSATGWQLKPEGLCKDEVCVPVPTGREAEFVQPGLVNFAAFARHLGMPVLRDAAHHAWSVGEAAADRNERRRSLIAPDFTLPDIDGREHSLSDYRGRKVFLASWASW